MKALRWILFCIVAFGLGTGVAFAVHPPTVGIPAATADGLAGDLAAIKRYAAEGRCDAVRGRLSGAQSKITKLPADTSDDLVNQLQSSLQDVSSAARSTCQSVSDAAAAAAKAKADAEAAQKAKEQAEATTPDPAPSTPDPTTTPDPGGNEGAPDPGSGEGSTGGVTPPDGPTEPDTSGGVTPDIEGVQQRLEQQRQKWERRLRTFEELLTR